VKRQSAVFVTVPADELVGAFRLRYQPRAVARLLPPHITVLPPFWRDVDADELLVAALGEHFAAFASFETQLVRVSSFPHHVWLAPEPHEDFVTMIAGTRDRFPEFVRDADREPVPHLTIAQIGKGDSKRAVVAHAEAEIAPHLPFAFNVRDVGLFEVRSDGWHEVHRFELR
jgi:2'-5' RNA ligase